MLFSSCADIKHLSTVHIAFHLTYSNFPGISSRAELMFVLIIGYGATGCSFSFFVFVLKPFPHFTCSSCSIKIRRILEIHSSTSCLPAFTRDHGEANKDKSELSSASFTFQHRHHHSKQEAIISKI